MFWRAGRRLARETRGTELAEAAVVLPLLFVVLIGVFWFGQAFRIYGALTHAAREGARAAVAPACATCAPNTAAQTAQNATTAITNAMIAAHLDTAQLAALGGWTPPQLCKCGTSCTVQQCDSSVTSINVCVQTNVQLSYASQGGAGTCGTSVSFRYKYPYRFTLPCWPQPCTSLDLSKISLPAQAQMRLETQ
jgi:Flp pilus assembly protein TadG